MTACSRLALVVIRAGPGRVGSQTPGRAIIVRQTGENTGNAEDPLSLSPSHPTVAGLDGLAAAGRPPTLNLVHHLIQLYCFPRRVPCSTLLEARCLYY